MRSTNAAQRKKRISSSFDTTGTEGMLDVILACTLIFILLTALIQIDNGKSQEMALPDMDLTKSQAKANGASAVRKTVVSIKMAGDAPEFYIENKVVSLEELKSELEKLSGIGHVALRRDKSIACEWEDKVILLCQEAGIDRIAIMVAAK